MAPSRLASPLHESGSMPRSTRRAPGLRYHFSGIAGAGMSPLASLMRLRGHSVQGSDRSLDQGKNAQVAASLRALGIEIHPHDGTAVTSAIDRFVHSTAVEASTPEMRAAEALGIARLLAAAGLSVARMWGIHSVTGLLPSTLLHRRRLPAVVRPVYAALCAVDRWVTRVPGARGLASSLVVLAAKR